MLDFKHYQLESHLCDFSLLKSSAIMWPVPGLCWPCMCLSSFPHDFPPSLFLQDCSLPILPITLSLIMSLRATLTSERHHEGLDMYTASLCCWRKLGGINGEMHAHSHLRTLKIQHYLIDQYCLFVFLGLRCWCAKEKQCFISSVSIWDKHQGPSLPIKADWNHRSVA